MKYLRIRVPGLHIIVVMLVCYRLIMTALSHHTGIVIFFPEPL
jgi:hypothetical protein